MIGRMDDIGYKGTRKEGKGMNELRNVKKCIEMVKWNEEKEMGGE